jgi:NADH:ubiquinone reductase (H+-translocating)
VSARPRVVIIGGGFGGLMAAKALRKADVDVTLLDRRNHHLFQPLLYQVATAALNPSDIAQPIRGILRRQRNVRVLLSEATVVNTAARHVTTTDGDVPYDYLIVATGATHSYFGNDAWAERAKGLKTIDDALEIRRRIFLAYEAAEKEEDGEKRRPLLTSVIVGGGPTGVEMAGALAEISRHSLRDDFRRIDPRTARVILVEGLDRVLPGYPPELSAKARKQLEHLGVEVWTGTRVTGIDEDGVSLGKERLHARTIVWAAGVQASPLAATLKVPLDRAGRVKVSPDLSIPGHPEVFVVGDLAAVLQDGTLLPGVAQVAIQAGRHTARHIARLASGSTEPAEPFRYKDPGSFATIGRGAAVGNIGRSHLSGFVAWAAWLLIHIAFLIGLRNRLAVLLNWAYSYVTWRRGAQLITGK